ncbi:MAG: kynureninase [Candidatus Kapabacteria bacterium]|nr:kynureninase [Candidatus Kapabacteria bacterium]
MQFENNLDYASKLDKIDPVRNFRDQFYIPKDSNGNELIYLCGNSLGLQPKSTRAKVEQELLDWENLGVEAHFLGKNPWKDYHEFVTDSLAKIVGAKPKEVVAMGSLTANLNSLLISFYKQNLERHKIVIEATAFPSDIYSVFSQIKLNGFNVDDSLIKLEAKANETYINTEDILSLIENEGDSIATILLGGVNYYTGQAFDMEAITKAGHKKGIIVGFDLAHAIGNLKLELNKWDVDFAVWCSYKYLNSGPGGIAGIFVNERFAKRFDIDRLSGWWGHDKTSRFKMDSQFVPMEGAEGWQNSNPAILPLACLRASLDLFDEAGMDKLKEKSIKLTGYLEFLLDLVDTDRIEIITPRDINQRGCQISLRVKNANKELFDQITRNGVIADWREPDVIRIAPVPLYNSFKDVYRFVEILKSCL